MHDGIGDDRGVAGDASAAEAVERAVDEIIDACDSDVDSDALIARLQRMPALAAGDERMRVSRRLAERVRARDEIRYPMLAALVEHFGWDTAVDESRWPAQEHERLHDFLRRRHLRELIAKRALPVELQTHYDDLVKHVVPPFGFWRALRISSLLLRDLRDSIDAVRAAFGPDSELIVSPEAEAFVRSVYRADGPLAHRFASAIGRAYGLSFALIMLFLLIGSIARGIPWALSHLLAWWLPIFIGCVVGVFVVRALRKMFGAA